MQRTGRKFRIAAIFLVLIIALGVWSAWLERRAAVEAAGVQANIRSGSVVAEAGGGVAGRGKRGARKWMAVPFFAPPCLWRLSFR